MIVKVMNRTNKNIITINNVRDITHYEHEVKGNVMVLSDINYGNDTHVNLNDYKLLSISN